MRKFMFRLIFVTGLVSTVTAHLSASQPIVVEYDADVATVQTIGRNLQITPIHENQTFSVETISQSNTILVFEDETDFPNTNREMELPQDLTGLDTINKTNKVFSFHNSGYLHAANEQKYENCLFHFEKPDAKVTLSPSSSTYNSSNLNDFSRFLGDLFANHRRNPLEIHQPSTPATCMIKQASVEPYRKLDVPINMTLKFKDELVFQSQMKDFKLNLTPNDNYVFQISNAHV